jgi:ribA/ribD-fused uncharacterized protein
MSRYAAFRGQKFYLSNFYPCAVEYEGIMYPSSEHAFQAAKTLDKEVRLEMSRVTYPAAAKKLGQRVELRPNWEEVKIEVMTEVVRAKFTQNEDCKIRLVRTEDEELVEHNTWGDRFWGVCKGVGENHLGQILMKIRSELSGTTKDDERP